MIERCGDHQRKCDGLEKWPLHFLMESPGNAPGCASPSRLRILPTHAVHQCLHRIHPHQPHWSWSCILPRSCDCRHVVICMPVPNADILCSSQFMEEGPVGDRLPHCPLQGSALPDPPDVEPSSISTDDDSTRERTFPTTRTVVEAKGSPHYSPRIS